MRVTERLTARHGALLVVDMQEKLLAAIPARASLTANVERLVHAAGLLEMPAWATEQYPKGLGPSIPSIAEKFPERPSKLSFHCCGVPWIVEQLYARHVRHVTVAGVEAHVCVAQTALELLDMGFRVQVPADAVASRKTLDWEFCLRRLEHAGATVSSTEAVLFEWLGTADRPEFKEISRMVKEAGPTSK